MSPFTSRPWEPASLRKQGVQTMTLAESQALIAFLFDWVRSPEIQVRFQWEEDSVAIWDNRCTQHHVLNDFDGERIIQRVTIMGDKPEPASPPRWQPFLKPLTAASRGLTAAGRDHSSPSRAT